MYGRSWVQFPSVNKNFFLSSYLHTIIHFHWFNLLFQGPRSKILSGGGSSVSGFFFFFFFSGGGGGGGDDIQ